ncbi:MAG: NAD(P)-dependent oxidoreductase [Mycobacteriales bacterium]
MKALITCEITDDGLQRLEALGYEIHRAGWGLTRRVLATDELIAAAQGAALVLTELEVVDAAVLDALPELRLVGTARGGPVNVDLAACDTRGLPVLYTPARNADSVADFVVGTILTLTRGIAAAERHLRDTGWQVDGELPYLHFRGPELSGLTVGVVGYGAIGRRVTQRLREGFGTTVIVHDPVQGLGGSLADVAAQADLLTVHCPRVPETRGLVDAELLAQLGAGWVVNTAGGGIVDEDALCDALDADALKGAALDCFATEPLPRDSRLLRTRNLLLTPHLAGAADDVVRHHSNLLVSDVERWHRGEALHHAAPSP